MDLRYSEFPIPVHQIEEIYNNNNIILKSQIIALKNALKRQIRSKKVFC